MGVENVACPNCGREALATVPSGQRLVKVSKFDMRGGSGYYTQTASCPHCEKTFYASTKETNQR